MTTSSAGAVLIFLHETDGASMGCIAHFEKIVLVKTAWRTFFVECVRGDTGQLFSAHVCLLWNTSTASIPSRFTVHVLHSYH